MDLSHIINHLGESHERYQGAGAPPVYQTNNFVFETVDDMRKALAFEMDTPFYTRGNNPTVTILREKIAALEGAEECLMFGSGSAAISAGILSSVQSGDHIVCVRKPYSWTNKLLNLFLPRYGVTATMVDGTDPENFRKAIQPNTRLIMLESPNSLTFEVQDIPAVVAIAQEHGILTAIDNSYATPLNQQPILMGVDMVFHSASKYLSGHSDVVAGVLCCSRKKAEQIFKSEFMTLGGVLSPHDAWLVLRGLRTLPLRMERVAESTPRVVDFLAAHPGVAHVYYPFLLSNPQYEVARKQMKRPGGQFSILLRTDSIEGADRFCNSLKRFLMACSWGGYESLIFPMSTLYGSANYQNNEIPWNLVRFYVGLEDPELLIADLAQALEKMGMGE
ncbi:MAG: aminotransferase class I/II-fold pyridoxal phosphate-dependent enzyme [Bacteroidetes bacterium]|nr:MAG: aminotransferase class I/II-fold pyridoxal phosphate-dependent enzyme [Bacteroidota bacterium]